jgi:serine/threonine protein kinase
MFAPLILVSNGNLMILSCGCVLQTLKIEGCKQRISAPCPQLSVGMGNFIGFGVQKSQSLDPSYTIPNSSCAEPKEGRMDILPCNFYRNQCRVLKKQLSDAEEILNKHTSPAWCDGTVSSAGLSWPQSALLELRRILKVGESLIEGCHNESCFKAYMRRGERTQAFAETVKEIIWCTSVGFYNGTTSLPKNASMSMNEFPLPELGAYKELWIERHQCSANECGGPDQQVEDSPLCIATQISQRIIEEKKKNDIAVIGTSPEADHTSVLWNIDGKILEDGKFIGSGAFCSVIETSWMGETYAKKNFQMENPAVFRNEANVLSKLTHPHMVTVSAYSVSPQVCSLLLERMPHDLRQYMMKRQEEDPINPPFTISAAFDLMLQVAEAMKYMHSEGMVHRDLKAGNILVRAVDDPELCRQGFVVAKLADFGLAKLKNEVTNYSHLTKNQGTRRWMAPEVFKADADNDERLLVAYPQKTDVYSFGIVCSEILTGKVPFQNVRLSELYELLTDTVNPLRPELPESCPESLAALIHTCWHTDPRKRPTFMEICTTLRYTKGLLMLTGNNTSTKIISTRIHLNQTT